ncbi:MULTISPECIES: hypothetical protein [unclassified Sphingobium]|uniref:hypothetical protein n=1 Tax=unclassified Sphingobium TaxID=2611147 RepID=UPI00045019F5|nr:hypothetical protein [Sphingobium sp. AntQ-1]EXS71090.1 hypothetical protein BF95_01495 [Sphingobium sp. Ant17]
MIDMNMALRALKRIALASSHRELDAARIEAADILDQAGWTRSARIVIDTIGLPIVRDDGDRPPK